MGKKDLIARRAMLDLIDGGVVNLGAGLPGKILDYLPKDVKIILHTENGIIGAIPKRTDEPDDAYCSDASENLVSIMLGGSIVDSSIAFGLVRGGHIDITVLGCMQVDQNGSMANWTVPGGRLIGMGGAMDLVAGAKRVIVTMEHNTKSGDAKILRECTYPLTGYGVVDTIITDLAYIKVTSEGLVLEELAPGVSVKEVISSTEAELIVSDRVRAMPV